MVLNDSNVAVRLPKTSVNGFAPTSFNAPSNNAPTLLNKFITGYNELQEYKQGKPVAVNGQTLSIAGVVAAARYGASTVLDDSASIKERVRKSRSVIATKVESGTSVYGLSTGFGGSADTRTDKPLLLGAALLQHQQVGVLPSSDAVLDVLPLLDPSSSTIMPESWVRGAMVVRMNSLIRGHSGVRWELIEKLNELVSAKITPVVPIRGSISASGDLSPLSYIAGTLVGNSAIRVFDGPATFGFRKMVPSKDALTSHNITPISLASKEHLGILNGTAFSASVAALALNDAAHLALLAQVCTALGTEALLGTAGNYHPFIHDTARPHPGQIEVAANVLNILQGSKFAQFHEQEVSIQEDKYMLRQDRYPLRTSPQFLGPQIEDILASLASITQECNSTTDNPLVDGETGETHHGGNFQAMAVTNAMEKTRLALHHIGKLIFSQSTELINPMMNHGLPPSLSATDPSLNYHTKGIDIATAAYVAELGYLASPVSTHIQSAEMHNQAINSLALISARATLNSLDVLSMLTASYLYVLCQALDLRALRKEFDAGLQTILFEELESVLNISPSLQPAFAKQIIDLVQDTLDKTSTMDCKDQMVAMASSTAVLLLDTLTGTSPLANPASLASIPAFRTNVASRAEDLIEQLRGSYLSGERGAAPASAYLGKSKAIYEYIRVTLGVSMHGKDNYSRFKNGFNADDSVLGKSITAIHEAIRDGRMQGIVAELFSLSVIA